MLESWIVRAVGFCVRTFAASCAPAGVFISWKALVKGDPQPSDLRRIIEVWPVLDHSDLEPGRKASDAIRDAAAQLTLDKTYGASIALTGSCWAFLA